MSASMMYRRVGDEDWLTGRTVNVSRSGVLFKAAPPVIPASTRVEFILLLPSLGLPGDSRVQCRGQVVRRCDEPAGGACAMAATIDAYDFLGIAPNTISGRIEGLIKGRS